MLKIALLENVHPVAASMFRNNGNDSIHTVTGALEGKDLRDLLRDVHILGIRSKTNLTAEMIEAAPNLMAVGCFCIGTDQVDLAAAQARADELGEG